MQFSVIEVGPLKCNCVLVSVSGHAVCVDPGGNVERILAEAARLRTSITSIYVTHGHFDHFLAAAELKEQTGATVHLHKDDLFLWEHLEEQCKAFRMHVPPSKIPKAPDVLLSGGEEITIRKILPKERRSNSPQHGSDTDSDRSSQRSGRTALWKQLPFATALHEAMQSTLKDLRLTKSRRRGRSRSSKRRNDGDVSFGSAIVVDESEDVISDEDDKIVIGNDSIGRYDLWGSNYSHLVASIHKLYETIPGDTVVIPGHGPSTSIDREKQFNFFVRSEDDGDIENSGSQAISQLAKMGTTSACCAGFASHF
ncbi:beta-lactamase-like protein [Cladochytrium replicatum]|nr:beta-lactamase-like protein [Cladochytrium replicatum]